MTVPDYQTPQPGEVQSLEAAFIDLDRATTRLSEDTPLYLEANDDPVAACLLLHDLREARKRLAEIEAFAEAEAARRIGKGQHKIPGFAVEVRGGSSWQEWRHDDVAWNLCRDIAVDPDTGELNPDVVPIIDMVRSRLLNCARPNWRLTQLRSHGINVGDYAKWQPARRTVTLTADADL